MPNFRRVAFGYFIPSIVYLFFFVCIQVSLGQQRSTVGQPYADFVLPRIDNREPVSLSQFRGKKVLLIHFASW